MMVDLANKTNWHRQTENTGINTQGIMRKMGDTCRRLETSTRTGETDQGVTIILFSNLFAHLLRMKHRNI
jgi:hypothetical protein